MRIRPIEPTDLEPLARMLERIDEFSPSEVTCAVELAQLAIEDPQGSGYRALVAEHEGVLGGYLCYGPIPLAKGSYDLYWVATAPEMRGKHAGSALVRAMESELRELKARVVRVETSSITEYGPARAFYARLAYEPVALIKDFYHPGDDLVVLTKRMDGEG